jgi:hypothetical protein
VIGGCFSVSTSDFWFGLSLFSIARDGCHSITAVAARVLSETIRVVDGMSASKAPNSHNTFSAFFVKANDTLCGNPITFPRSGNHASGRVNGIPIRIFLTHNRRFPVFEIALLPVETAVFGVEEEPDGSYDDDGKDEGEQ